MHLPTVARMVGKSFRHPARALKNGLRVINHRLRDFEEERARLFAFLEDAYDANTAALLQEFEASPFKAWMQSRREALANFSGPYRFATTREWDCEALYFLVRAAKPRVAVETGVCYGCSTSYILEAMARNGVGTLYSLDLGNSAEEPQNDFFVNPAHKRNWHLVLGDVRSELPRLLRKLGQIDLFHHDSLHTYDHMMWEYETAFRYMDPSGAISSDDVDAILTLARPFRNSPFVDFAARHRMKWRTVGNTGVAVDSSPAAARMRWQRIHGRVTDAVKPEPAKEFERSFKIA